MNNWMRKIGLMLLIAMLMLPVAAQVAFGVRAGTAYSSLIQNINGTYESGARFGFSVAGVADIPLYKRFSLRPEIALVNQGGTYYSAPEMGGMSMYNKYNYYSIQIPVSLAYTFVFTDVRFSIFAGPTLDFSLFGKMRTKDTDVSLEFDDAREKDLKPFDLGVNVGLGVEYSNFFFSINSVCGTLDRRAVKREGESSVYQNNVTFSLGYFFRSR